MSENSKIKVMVVDDHMLVVRGIVSLLSFELDIKVVGTALSAAECMNWLNEIQPDVILLDVILPDCSGVDIIAPIKKKSPDTRIVMLAGEVPKGYLESSLIQGASGFILKNCSPNEMYTAIRKAAKGERYFSESLAEFYHRHIGQKRETFTQRSEAAELLTTREKQILMFLAQGMQNKAIAEELTLSKRTVEGHVLKLLEKLNFKTRNEAAAFYLGLKDDNFITNFKN